MGRPKVTVESAKQVAVQTDSGTRQILAAVRWQTETTTEAVRMPGSRATAFLVTCARASRLLPQAVAAELDREKRWRDAELEWFPGLTRHALRWGDHPGPEDRHLLGPAHGIRLL